MNDWVDAKTPKTYFEAKNNLGWHGKLYVQSLKPDRIGATGMSFHNGVLASMGIWTEFDIETGTEIWPDWRKKRGEFPADGELSQIGAEYLEKIREDVANAYQGK